MSCASTSASTQVDLVANDTGGAVAQVFAARYPERIRTLTLTNCDVHDNFPPEAFKPFVDLAESGEFGPMVAAMAADLALARSEVGFGMGYAHPEQLSDESWPAISRRSSPIRARGSSVSSRRRRRPS